MAVSERWEEGERGDGKSGSLYRKLRSVVDVANQRECHAAGANVGC
jgi:hypothetical protein